MRIRARKSDPIESIDRIDRVEQLSKRSLNLSTRPGKRLSIPEFFSRLFSVAIDILSEESDFFGTMLYGFSDLVEDIFTRTRDFSSSREWHDTVGAVVVTSSLDDNIRRSGVFLQLLDGEIFVVFGIISHIDS